MSASEKWWRRAEQRVSNEVVEVSKRAKVRRRRKRHERGGCLKAGETWRICSTLYTSLDGSCTKNTNFSELFQDDKMDRMRTKMNASRESVVEVDRMRELKRRLARPINCIRWTELLRALAGLPPGTVPSSESSEDCRTFRVSSKRLRALSAARDGEKKILG